MTIFKVALIPSQWKHEIVDPFLGMGNAATGLPLSTPL